ncbi:MAG: class I SAM-dependent methyltransferase [Gammaproteobacteria bacterium]|nr:class I SAM-dependent methyltransferase [Gammaproteobacteria bacterium]
MRTAVWASEDHGQERAMRLSRTLSLPLTTRSQTDQWELIIECASQGLVLRDMRIPRLKPIGVEFDIRARRRVNSRRNPMARAMGKKTHTVVDATAGFGDDAWRLVCMGYQVIAMERSPLIGALLEDARQRLLDTGEKFAKHCFQIILGDARELLQQLCSRPDVVYIDTMFPPKRKSSALARRKLRLLREIVGDDNDVELLFRAALNKAKRRVVVKRPTYASPLMVAPVVAFSGKLARYDVYHACHRQQDPGRLHSINSPT